MSERVIAPPSFGSATEDETPLRDSSSSTSSLPGRKSPQIMSRLASVIQSLFTSPVSRSLAASSSQDNPNFHGERTPTLNAQSVLRRESTRIIKTTDVGVGTDSNPCIIDGDSVIKHARVGSVSDMDFFSQNMTSSSSARAPIASSAWRDARLVSNTSASWGGARSAPHRSAALMRRMHVGLRTAAFASSRQGRPRRVSASPPALPVTSNAGAYPNDADPTDPDSMILVSPLLSPHVKNQRCRSEDANSVDDVDDDEKNNIECEGDASSSSAKPSTAVALTAQDLLGSSTAQFDIEEGCIDDDLDFEALSLSPPPYVDDLARPQVPLAIDTIHVHVKEESDPRSRSPGLGLHLHPCDDTEAVVVRAGTCEGRSAGDRCEDRDREKIDYEMLHVSDTKEEFVIANFYFPVLEHGHGEEHGNIDEGNAKDARPDLECIEEAGDVVCVPVTAGKVAEPYSPSSLPTLSSSLSTLMKRNAPDFAYIADVNVIATVTNPFADRVGPGFDSPIEPDGSDGELCTRHDMKMRSMPSSSLSEPSPSSISSSAVVTSSLTTSSAANVALRTPSRRKRLEQILYLVKKYRIVQENSIMQKEFMVGPDIWAPLMQYFVDYPMLVDLDAALEPTLSAMDRSTDTHASLDDVKVIVEGSSIGEDRQQTHVSADLLFYVKFCTGESSASPGYMRPSVMPRPRLSRTLPPFQDTSVDWERTVSLNLLLREFVFELEITRSVKTTDGSGELIGVSPRHVQTAYFPARASIVETRRDRAAHLVLPHAAPSPVAVSRTHELYEALADAYGFKMKPSSKSATLSSRPSVVSSSERHVTDGDMADGDAGACLSYPILTFSLCSTNQVTCGEVVSVNAGEVLSYGLRAYRLSDVVGAHAQSSSVSLEAALRKTNGVIVFEGTISYDSMKDAFCKARSQRTGYMNVAPAMSQPELLTLRDRNDNECVRVVLSLASASASASESAPTTPADRSLGSRDAGSIGGSYMRRGDDVISQESSSLDVAHDVSIRSPGVSGFTNFLQALSPPGASESANFSSTSASSLALASSALSNAFSAVKTAISSRFDAFDYDSDPCIDTRVSMLRVHWADVLGKLL